jgi:hypothetical protein
MADVSTTRAASFRTRQQLPPFENAAPTLAFVSALWNAPNLPRAPSVVPEPSPGRRLPSCGITPPLGIYRSASPDSLSRRV